MQDDKPRAIYTHCYGHTLNLAAYDVVKANKLLGDALDVNSKLFKFSPKRESMFKRITSELSTDQPGLRVLCPTRWIVHFHALDSIIFNYEALF